MKTLLNLLSFVLLFTITSCDKVIEERFYTANVPIYMSYDELRSADAIGSIPAQKLEDPGKIYLYNNYLFINERRKGIHVIDNSDPNNPQKISFISIPGNVDISVKSNILYADNYTDLLAVDISDPNQVVLRSRLNNAFSQAYYPAPDPRYPIAKLDPDKGVVIGWKIEEVKEVVEDNLSALPDNFSSFANDAQSNSRDGAAMFSGGSQSVGGSMARFEIYGDYLYTLEPNLLGVYNISEAGSPQKTTEVALNRQSETLFNYEQNLFIGTTTGMLVYSLQNPSSPVFTSNFNHAESCDPVVVENGFAYITLRSGSRCGGWNNQLDVVNIQNLNSPFLVRSYPMSNPMGLGISDNTLFICDGDAGLKVYNATNKNNIDLLAQFSGIVAYDVIPINGLLMLTGEQGIYQYDYSDIYNIHLISTIPIE